MKYEILQFNHIAGRVDASLDAGSNFKSCTIKRISMSISGSCLTAPGNCPGQPLIALQDRPCGPINRLFEITINPWSYATSVDEGTTAVIVSGMNFYNP